MAFITRIKTNQISDGNVTAAKIASQTLTGGLFAPTLSLNSNVTILGNLTVAGNTSSINSVNTYVQDPLVVFNNGYTGSMSGYDVGIIVNRNYATLSQYGAVNTAWVWVENDQAFESITTTTSGNALTTLTSSGFANLKVGNITAPSVASSGTISAGLFTGPVTSTTGSFTTLIATNFSSGNAVITGGYITGLANLQTTNMTSTTATSTNFSTGNAVISGGYITGLANLQATAISGTTGVITNFSSGNAVIGTLTTTTAVATNVSSANAVITGGYINNLSNVTATFGNVASLNVSGNVTGSLIPSANVTYDLGSSSFRWRDLYLNGSTINLGSAQISAVGGVMTTASPLFSGQTVINNLSTGNILITGGNINGLTTLGATTGVVTNFSAGNALITAGSITTGVVTNLSSGNAVISGGSANGLTTLSATTATATNFSSANAVITSAGITTLVATNFSSANAVITGGSLTGDVTVQGTTGQFTNFSTGNALVTGGTLSGLTSASTTTLQATNLSSGNVQITGADNNGIQYTSGALQISGGAGISGSLYVQGNLYAGNLISTTTQILQVTDPLLYLSASNPSTYNYEIGIYSHFGPTGGYSYQHTGFVRDHNDYTWKLFSNVPEPSGGTINLTNAIYDTLKLGTLLAVNTASSMSTTIGQSILASGGVGIAANLAVGGNIIVAGSAGTAGQVLQSTGTGLQWYSIPVGTNIANGTSNVTIASSGGIVTIGVANSNAAAFSSTGVQVNGTLGVTGATTLSSLTATSATITGLGATTLVSTNFSSGNAVITGGYITGLANLQTTNMTSTTSVDTNFSTANAVITGGYITGLANLQATAISGTTGVVTNFSSGNAVIGTLTTTTATATNFSTANALVTSGAVNGLSTLAATTGIVTNLSSGNTRIGSGYADNFAIGANTAATGAFTTLSSSGITTHAGNVVITSGVLADPLTNNTGALVITGQGGIYAGGNINLDGQGFFGPGNHLTSLTNAPVVVTGSANSFVQVSVQNNSNGTSASGDFVATADTGTDSSKYIDVGINNSGFTASGAWTMSGALDGYMYVNSGNLTVGTDTIGKTVSIHTGGTFANSIVATFNANNVQPTSSTTGAVVIPSGGLGVYGNVNVGGAVTLNSSQTAGYDVIIKGKNDSALFTARPNATYDTVVIGSGSNSSFSGGVVTGAKLAINTTDSILLPVGTGAQRPGLVGGTDIEGMFRYNKSLATIEWYNGATWKTASTNFTIIADEQFNGDGSTSIFSLATTQTTASCIVSINGVVQIPSLAYAVSGTAPSCVITFTEPPAVGDVIDVRELTTSVSVTSISDGTFQLETKLGVGVNIYTGVGSAAVTTNWNAAGAEVNLVANVTVGSASTLTTLDSFYANTYSSAEYTVTSTIAGTNIRQIAKVLVVTDGTTAMVTTYGVTATSSNTLATFSGNVTSGSVNLGITTTNASTINRVRKNYQAI